MVRITLTQLRVEEDEDEEDEEEGLRVPFGQHGRWPGPLGQRLTRSTAARCAADVDGR